MSDVTGKVVNYWTGDPISNATITFNGIMGNTDINGNFQISLPADVYKIIVIHRDYERTEFSADFRIDQAYTIEPLRVKPIFRAL